MEIRQLGATLILTLREMNGVLEGRWFGVERCGIIWLYIIL